MPFSTKESEKDSITDNFQVKIPFIENFGYDLNDSNDEDPFIRYNHDETKLFSLKKI